MRYTLVDAEAEHTAHPRTFAVPGIGEMLALRPGAFVKIGVRFGQPFADEPVRGERFWVRVTRMGFPMRGTISNDLVYTAEHGLACDDSIEFELRHVLRVLPA